MVTATLTATYADKEVTNHPKIPIKKRILRTGSHAFVSSFSIFSLQHIRGIRKDFRSIPNTNLNAPAYWLINTDIVSVQHSMYTKEHLKCVEGIYSHNKITQPQRATRDTATLQCRTYAISSSTSTSKAIDKHPSCHDTVDRQTETIKQAPFALSRQSLTRVTLRHLGFLAHSKNYICTYQTTTIPR